MTLVARSRAELVRGRAEVESSADGGPVAVVMTMGALHAGHAELIRQARHRAAAVVVTVFLNPLQFAPGEDLAKYPRTFDSDLELCRGVGVDLVFAPTPDVVYPAGEPLVRVSAGPVGDILEGASRPGHFDGVLTVVAKLLQLTSPDLAYFGQKDAQQLWLIDRMVHDLDFPVEVLAVPTVRDDTGLALSSRNTYLSRAQRSDALALSAALHAGRDQADRGSDAVLVAARRLLEQRPNVDVDYVALVDPATFGPADASFSGEALLLVAARVGPTRLIDNLRVSVARKA